MPRADLDLLVERRSIRQAALVERRRHQRRGGDRLPGTRRASFSRSSPTLNRSGPPSWTCARSAPRGTGRPV
jgi:hypothetical protein